MRIRSPSTGQTAQLSTKADVALDTETKDTYMVTVTATDTSGLTATITVTIKVTNVDEAPEISESAAWRYRARQESTTRRTTQAWWQCTRASGPDVGLRHVDAGRSRTPGEFSISSDGMLMFMTAPNYEMPTDMGGDNMYMVTVMADDGTYMDTHDVTVMVTNVEEDGDGGRCRRNNPGLEVELTAMLSDLDDRRHAHSHYLAVGQSPMTH